MRAKFRNSKITKELVDQLKSTNVLLARERDGLIDTVAAWEQRYFEQRKAYDELVSSMRKFIREEKA